MLGSVFVYLVDFLSFLMSYVDVGAPYWAPFVGGTFCQTNHSQVNTQRLDINYKFSPNSSVLLLDNSYKFQLFNGRLYFL